MLRNLRISLVQQHHITSSDVALHLHSFPSEQQDVNLALLVTILLCHFHNFHGFCGYKVVCWNEIIINHRQCLLDKRTGPLCATVGQKQRIQVSAVIGTK